MILTPPAERECPVVTREDIARVCAATGDPSPLHLDEKFAHAAGYPNVVAPGTMLLGWVGAFLEDWADGSAAIDNWTITFRSPIWPGDRITLSGSISPPEAPDERPVGEIRARAQDGREVSLTTVTFAMHGSAERH